MNSIRKKVVLFESPWCKTIVSRTQDNFPSHHSISLCTYFCCTGWVLNLEKRKKGKEDDIAAVLQIVQNHNPHIYWRMLSSAVTDSKHLSLLLRANCRCQRYRFPEVSCAKSRKVLRRSDYINKQLFTFLMLILVVRNLILLWNDCAAIQQKGSHSQQRAALHNLGLKLQCSATEHQCYCPCYWYVMSWTFRKYFPLISGDPRF